MRTRDEIDEAEGLAQMFSREVSDPVAAADLNTSMCDYRIALSLALGRIPDRNGYYRVGVWLR
ncbi:hypothetical protein SAMN04488581_2654 [Mycolicibacterium neoaurum]|nr:hypothetical protein SAMN04488581_2654 [Mycolicibacterium neoaurum]